MGWQYRGPRYMAPQRTPHQDAETRLAIEAYVGQRSPDPRLVRYFSERTRLMQLADPIDSDDAKRRLVAEGPRCSPADETHALSICDPGRHWTAHPEAQAALAPHQAGRPSNRRAPRSIIVLDLGQFAFEPGRAPVVMSRPAALGAGLGPVV